MENRVFDIVGFVHALSNRLGLIRAEAEYISSSKPDLLAREGEVAESISAILRNASEGLAFLRSLRLAEPLTASQPLPVKAAIDLALSGIDVPSTIELSIEIADELPPVLDAEGLGTVLANLLSNAIEAMAVGGRLAIIVTPHHGDRMLSIQITDTGRGIPVYLHSAIFEPYVSTKLEPGHGLGLWWAKTYIESLGGTLTLIRSEPGNGTSFLATIPAAS